MALQYMRRVIKKKAKFDIMDLNCLKVASKTYIPALFGHASDDKFIQPHHADHIFKSYSGDKNIIKFDGDHNTSRPQFYYDSVSIFFYNVLHPPQVSTPYSSKLEKYYKLGDLNVGAGNNESMIYNIINGLRSVSTNAASSSSAPPSISTAKSVDELLTESTSSTIDIMLNEDNAQNCDDASLVQNKADIQNQEECCSYTSSNRESWGRCSSLGGTDEESSAECTAAEKNQKITVEALATATRHTSPDPPKEEKKINSEKSRSDKFEKLEALSKRLRLCILRRGPHNRHSSA